VQHWRSRADCERFARAAAQPHLPVWRWFSRAVGASGDVGIWHETYPVREGESESFYANMPPMGLALAAARRRLAQPAVHRLAAEQGRVHDRVG
jgi:hypothetical protein